jgi:hypothetical protein
VSLLELVEEEALRRASAALRAWAECPRQETWEALEEALDAVRAAAGVRVREQERRSA